MEDTFARSEEGGDSGSFKNAGAEKGGIVVCEKSKFNAECDGGYKAISRLIKLDFVGAGPVVGGPTIGDVVVPMVNGLGQQSQSSDPISCSNVGFKGPLRQNKPNKKKALGDIYKALKIPYMPSYFTELLHSQFKPNLKPLHCQNSPKKINDTTIMVSESSGRPVEPSSPWESLSESGMQRGNRKTWKEIENILRKVWSSIKDMGVEGGGGGKMPRCLKE